MCVCVCVCNNRFLNQNTVCRIFLLINSFIDISFSLHQVKKKKSCLMDFIKMPVTETGREGMECITPLRIAKSAGSYEHANECPWSIKCWKFLD